MQHDLHVFYDCKTSETIHIHNDTIKRFQLLTVGPSSRFGPSVLLNAGEEHRLEPEIVRNPIPPTVQENIQKVGLVMKMHVRVSFTKSRFQIAVIFFSVHL